MGELTSRYKRRLKTDADKKARLLCILDERLIRDSRGYVDQDRDMISFVCC